VHAGFVSAAGRPVRAGGKGKKAAIAAKRTPAHTVFISLSNSPATPSTRHARDVSAAAKKIKGSKVSQAALESLAAFEVREGESV
jgi:hypothetical protein